MSSETLYPNYQWGDYWTPPESDDASIPDDVVYDFQQGRFRHCLNLAEVRAKQYEDADDYRKEWLDWYDKQRQIKSYRVIDTLIKWVDANIRSKVDGSEGVGHG